MFDDKATSGELTTNFQALRVICLERFWHEPRARFTDAEQEAISELFADAAKAHCSSPRYEGAVNRQGQRDWRDNEGLAILVRDLEDLPVAAPKWMLLFGWLAPESAVAHCPSLVATLVKRTLAGDLSR